MLFSRITVVFLCYFILPSDTLQCTTNCSFIHNFTQPFFIPDQCNQIVLADKCTANVGIQYTEQTYSVRIDANPSTYILNYENTRSTIMIFTPGSSAYLIYGVSYACKNTDDCARHLISNAAIDILQRQFNVLPIVNELPPLITPSHSPIINSTFTCYDEIDNTLPCNISTYYGICVIQNDIKANSINRSCNYKQLTRSVILSLYQTPNSARFRSIVIKHCVIIIQHYKR